MGDRSALFFLRLKDKKIRSCFFKAVKSKKMNCVSVSAAAQHIEAPPYAKKNHPVNQGDLLNVAVVGISYSGATGFNKLSTFTDLGISF